MGSLTGAGVRRGVKQLLGAARSREPAQDATVLIYHRVGGQTPDERDLGITAFEEQVELLSEHRVVSLDDAADEVAAGDRRQKVVLTFDDGFADVHEVAWPILRNARLPFTIYLTTAYVGGQMHWDGSTATEGGPGLTWAQLEELVESDLVTIANHTHTHARPEDLTVEELDRCSELIEQRLGVTPQHFAYTWGVPVPSASQLLASRFRTAATGQVGRVTPDSDAMQWERVPVRNTDPLAFFAAKLHGDLTPERLYERVVSTAKAAGATA